MALKQMGTDTSATYLLDYSPSQGKKAEGAFHTLRVSSTRKGVRIFSPEIYVADAIQEPPKVSSRVSTTQILPMEPAFTFVGSVRSIKGQSMVLELDDSRFVVIDFERNAKVSLSNGDRISVRSNQYDGHGMVAKSWSPLQPAEQAGTVLARAPERSSCGGPGTSEGPGNGEADDSRASGLPLQRSGGAI